MNLGWQGESGGWNEGKVCFQGLAIALGLAGVQSLGGEQLLLFYLLIFMMFVSLSWLFYFHLIC